MGKKELDSYDNNHCGEALFIGSLDACWSKNPFHPSK